jgi:hypothetical protein
LGAAIFLLGGPLANLASGMTAAWLAAGDLPGLARLWLGLFAVHSIFIGTVNLLPLRERRLDSDGLALLRLLACGNSGIR